MSKMFAMGVLLTAKDMLSPILGKTDKGLGNIQSKAGKLNKAFRQSEKATKALAAKLSDVDRKLKSVSIQKFRLKDDLENGRISADRFAQKMALIDRKEQVLNRRKLRLKNELDRASGSARKLERQLGSVERKLRIIKKLDKIAFKSIAAGTALTGAGVMTRSMSETPISAFTELEDAKTMLEMSMMDSSGNVPKSFAEINRQALELGNRLPGTTKDFYRIATVLRQLGVSEESITGGVLKSSAYLAVVLKGMGVSYQEAAEATAQFKKAWGIEDSNMLKFIDLTQRMAHTGVNLTQMKYAFTKVGGALKGMGISGYEAAKQMAPFIGMLINTGHSGETVGTNLGSAMQRALLFDGTKAARKIRKQYGIRFKFTDAKGEFIGLEAMIAQLEHKLKGLSAQQRTYVLSKMFGTGESLGMINALLAKGVEGYRKYRKEMERQADINQRVNRSLSTLSATWEAFSGTVENIFAIIGAQAAPTLKAITEKLNAFADATTKFAEAHPVLTKWVSMAVIGASGALTALGGAAIIFGVLAKASKLAVSPISKAVGLFGRLTGKSQSLSKGLCGIEGCASNATTGLETLNRKVKQSLRIFSSPLKLAVTLVGAAAVVAGLGKLAKDARQAIRDKRSITPTKDNLAKLQAKEARLKKRLEAMQKPWWSPSALWESFAHGTNDAAKKRQLEKLLARTRQNIQTAKAGTYRAPEIIPKPISEQQRERVMAYARLKQRLYPAPGESGDEHIARNIVSALSPGGENRAELGALQSQYQALSSTVQTLASRPEQHNYQVSVVVNNPRNDAEIEAAVARAIQRAGYERAQRTMSDL
jgi:TP901 family phage tail tape measure protein